MQTAIASMQPGERIGRLTLVSSFRDGAKVRWVCVCDCGATTAPRADHIRAGSTRSCGCGEGSAKHGHGARGKRSAEYNAWINMRERCERPTHPSYKHYGARGIRVCERWHDFAAFLADMGPKPAGLTLERIDNDRGYEPGNCRWATYADQNRNRRRLS